MLSNVVFALNKICMIRIWTWLLQNVYDSMNYVQIFNLTDYKIATNLNVKKKNNWYCLKIMVYIDLM